MLLYFFNFFATHFWVGTHDWGIADREGVGCRTGEYGVVSGITRKYGVGIREKGDYGG